MSSSAEDFDHPGPSGAETPPRPPRVPWEPLADYETRVPPSPEPPEEPELDKSSGTQERSGGFLGFLKETTIVLGIALVISIVLKTFLIQAFYIPSESMQNTLQVGDRLIVNKLKGNQQDLNRGDVVVFVDPGGWLRPQTSEPSAAQKALTWVGLLPENANEHLIKRIIGLPGDTVECCDDDGRILVNDTPINEPYVYPGAAPSEKEFSVTVPNAHLWLLGDNRSRSQDSRYSEGAIGGGFVPTRNVVGAAWVIVWPFNHATFLKNPESTFADVPGG